MRLREIERAKAAAVRARQRFEKTLGEIERRLRPGNLADEAWQGVKDKGADLADNALEAVKRRPAAVSVALGGFALFLARDPLKRGLMKLIRTDEPEPGSESADARLNAGEGVT